ncbi:MAG TPA: hypothetical protein DCL54_10950 [Alphaproteobacteria bacterium]|nr:hypothetical protein [Alphaproteobacteria bacterium]HAJ47086.1 hypothetical protein [Alphaproteobacteria bacterium]
MQVWSQILAKPRFVLAAGFALAVLTAVFANALSGASPVDVISRPGFWALILRWLHVLAGIVWLGFHYYFTFVQPPGSLSQPQTTAPGAGAPQAALLQGLWLLRWAAMATLITGLILAQLVRGVVDVLSFGAAFDFPLYEVLLALGMWLAIIMWFNTWFVVWPSLQRGLNLENRFPELSKDQRSAAMMRATAYGRTNVVLSIPMLLCMTAAQSVMTSGALG